MSTIPLHCVVLIFRNDTTPAHTWRGMNHLLVDERVVEQQGMLLPLVIVQTILRLVHIDIRVSHLGLVRQRNTLVGFSRTTFCTSVTLREISTQTGVQSEKQVRAARKSQGTDAERRPIPGKRDPPVQFRLRRVFALMADLFQTQNANSWFFYFLFLPKILEPGKQTFSIKVHSMTKIFTCIWYHVSGLHHRDGFTSWTTPTVFWKTRSDMMNVQAYCSLSLQLKKFFMKLQHSHILGGELRVWLNLKRKLLLYTRNIMIPWK